MSAPGQATRKLGQSCVFVGLSTCLSLSAACNGRASNEAPELTDAARPNGALTASAPLPLPGYLPSPTGTPVITSTASGAEKVDFQDVAMGTNVHFIAYTSSHADSPRVKVAIEAALAEMKRLEGTLSEWRDDSEVGRINLQPGLWHGVGADTFTVISRALEAGKASAGAFDITFQAMSALWKFGDAADEPPKLPSSADVSERRKLVDYRTVELDTQARAVRIPPRHAIGLGGIAKGYIVDRAADILKRAEIDSFLVQAGGDLFGAGHKPDGSPWVSGIQDPREAQGVFFATLELTDHAFSTAGDYARSYVIGKRRYHHIIDPRTGYPATASRSVTVWADDATTADAIDDAVFILGPARGLKLVEATPGVGAVIVDKNNKVWISQRLVGKVHVTRKPTDGI